MSTKTDTWMPLYVGDYLRDTGRLTTELHGAYLLLIMDYWVNGAPPDDDEVLAAIARLPIARWKKARATLAGFFQIADGRWTHKRVEAELDGARSNKEQKAKAGRASAERRAQQKSNGQSTHVQQPLNSRCPAVATEPSTERQREVNPSPSPSPSPNRPYLAAAAGTDAREGRTQAAARLISEFDLARVEVFGEENRRPWPSALDLSEAERWIEAGATEAHCSAVFRAVFQRQRASGKRPAGTLSYMRNAVIEASQAPPIAENLSPQARSDALLERVRAAMGD